MKSRFKVGDLVRHIYMDGNPIGIVTRSVYFGHWVQRPNGRGGDHIDVLLDGREVEYTGRPKYIGERVSDN